MKALHHLAVIADAADAVITEIADLRTPAQARLALALHAYRPPYEIRSSNGNASVDEMVVWLTLLAEEDKDDKN